MYTCVLCSTPLDEHNITIEHILPAALGGAMTTSEVICSSCNKESGRLLDSVLLDRLALLVTQFRIKNAREPNKPIPPLKYEADGRRFQFKPTDKFVTIRDRRFSEEKTENLTHYMLDVPISDTTDEVIATHLRNMKIHHGAENIVAEHTEEIVAIAPAVKWNIGSLDTDSDFKRALAKVALVFAAECLRLAELPEPDFTGAIDYVHGTSNNELVTCFPFTISHHFVNEIPPKHALIMCDAAGKTWVYGLLFGGVSFVVNLADTLKRSKAVRKAFVFDPEIHECYELADSNHNELLYDPAGETPEVRLALMYSSLANALENEVNTNNAECLLGNARIACALKARGQGITLEVGPRMAE